ncbi:MAG: hypothetical protein A2860_02280 [Candidatus Levybacteria bacterium RIFCSPHIGHO2_01_FULL_37_33]|nr:MAG: hypothetical protein A2860_02280 [Candidatus Levybacteria bacterium RIFCSPHIGHO2_01_FULL_37_33]OGH16825.1 MAG: hypothetical protein A3C97_02940 [Candidatus Levybacteria bacterium RIFCSPHIGHO2_02_FULL_37_11]OGH33133.1 MAG: hypothetical protein A2953_03120 [Candidatus Levybacteria bacterium RIFCSPLOWO2_01_FULL_36_54]
MIERFAPAGINTVIVGNNREYFSPLDPHVPDAIRDEFVQSDIDEADMDVMWHGDNKIVLLPENIDPDFISDVSQLFDYKNIHVFAPHDKGNGLSRNVIQDQRVYDMISTSLRLSHESKVIPWGHTSQYQELTDRLRDSGLIFSTPETPERNSLWVPEYLDTKLRSREVLLRAKDKNPNVKVPEGFVCPDINSSMQIAEYFLRTGRGIVFKANLGAAGVGVHVFPPTEFNRNMDDNKAKMEAVIRKNPLLVNGPILMEEYIPPDFSHHGVFPSVDSVVSPDGTVDVQMVDAMVIHHDEDEVSFYGCVLGRGLFTEDQNKKLKEMSMSVGQELSKVGYRGWYDVDYILSQSGDFYATEANLRRTSICYMLDLAKLLFGDNYEDKMAMRSNDKYIRPNMKGLSYRDLKTILEPVLYPMEEQQRGIVITQSFRSMYDRGKFGYVSIGTDQNDTRNIELELDGLLKKV